MTTIAADERRVRAERDDEAERLFDLSAARYLVDRLELARLLLRISEQKTYVLSGCASAVEYAGRRNVPAVEARMLLDLARSLDVPAPPAPPPATPTTPTPAPTTSTATATATSSAGDPTPATAPARPQRVEDLVRAGVIPVANAIVLGQLVKTPGAIRPGEDWARDAATFSEEEFKRRARKRIEETRQGEPTSFLPLQVTATAKRNFERARKIASAKAGTMLTESETFALVVKHFVATFGGDEEGTGTRRLPDTSEMPRSRYVPAEVRREVHQRSRRRCEVPGCTNHVFRQLAHIDDHGEGGDREASNLLDLCSLHHLLFDAGRIRFAGWDAEGRPRFLDPRGELMTHHPAPIPPGAAEYELPRERHQERDPGSGNVAERPPPRWGEAGARRHAG